MTNDPLLLTWGLLGLAMILVLFTSRLLFRRKQRANGLLDYQRKIYHKADAARMGDRDYWQEWR